MSAHPWLTRLTSGARSVGLDALCGALLGAMSALYAVRPSLRSALDGHDGPLDFGVGVATRSGTVAWSLLCRGGRLTVHRGLRSDVDVTLRFADEAALEAMLRSTPADVLDLILQNQLVPDGSWVVLQRFNYLVALVAGGVHRRLRESAERERRAARGGPTPGSRGLRRALRSRTAGGLSAAATDAGVVWLREPYLSAYGLSDFPRLQAFRQAHLDTRPEICAERPALMTTWFREHGFERRADGRPWHAVERQGRVFAHLMRHRTPVIRRGDLLPGSTTRNPVAGSVVFPDGQGAMIWGELGSISERPLLPFDISPQTARTLHHDVFPFWTRRNFRDWVRARCGDQPWLAMGERWAAYFVWKSVGISHTIVDFESLLALGTSGLAARIAARLARTDGPESRVTYRAMLDCLEGVEAYAALLAEHAAALAGPEADPVRAAELAEMARICQRVPRLPATTLHEALTSLWIVWVALHNENNDTGLSLGRLDQLLQPAFDADMRRQTTEAGRRACVERAIELVGAFFLRCTDHFPLSPDIGNTLFGGASSTQAVTLGGVCRDGSDAVNDMTYVLLKVTELLGLRDVNVNARFKPGVSSDTYLKRLCEVNFTTAGTPSMHNDDAVFAALAPHGYSEEDIRDWAATGCVEPSIAGKHMGHTGAILMNLVAGLEMALHDGRHPLIGDVGPKTGDVEAGAFETFDDFFAAYTAQQGHLVAMAVELNNQLALTHAEHRPTPLLSALMGGTLESGRDVTRGGATYNSSGSSNIGLADVTDSLLVISALVFESRAMSLGALKRALGSPAEAERVAALAARRVPRFGSGDPRAVAMANRVTRMVHGLYARHRNARGGPYTCGFWSMSQHVAYGNLSGALPSGRAANKPFTPGLTPQPGASRSFLDNIRDVAGLDPRCMDNNMAFNVRLVPSASDSREKTVSTMHAYVKSYFELGGMQMQFNVASAETLRDAMANPEEYRGLLVRISGYNAYFVTLNEQIQLELIERAEFGL